MEKKTLGFFYTYGFTFVTLLIYSAFEFLSRMIGTDGIDAISANLLRYILGSAAIFSILIYRRNWRISGKELLIAFVIGIVYICIGSTFVQFSFGENGVSVGLLLILCSTPPLFITLLSSWIKKSPLTIMEKYGTAIGFIGIIVSFADKVNSIGTSIWPYILCFIGNILYVVYVVMLSDFTDKIDAVKVTGYSYLFGSVALFIASSASGVATNFGYIFNPKMLIMGILLTGLATFSLFKGIKLLGNTKSSSIISLKPFLSSILIFIFIGEKISPCMLVGTIVLVLGVYIVVAGNSIDWRKTFKPKLNKILAIIKVTIH